MSISKFLAFDFGAESGRAIVGILDGERISLEEMHRFPNRQTKILGHLHWDVLALFEEIKTGMKIAVQKGHGDIESVGIDTWGVDFGLVGKNGELLGFPFAYRDCRTDGMMERVFEKMSREEIYSATGIQFMQINTLYQLYSVALSDPKLLSICDRLLFMPDLFCFLLTGRKCSEYTIASTSQLLNAAKRNWDESIFSRLALPMNIMAPVVQPGTVIGALLSEISAEVGLKKGIDVIAVGCHDTASAVAAVPARGKNWAYLSSGTWSLIGIESERPLITAETMSDFTNEGGVGNTIRFLRNVMGLWLLQECRKSWKKSGEEYSYDQLVAMAAEAEGSACTIDSDDASFLNPADMLEAIKNYCRKTNQHVPESKGEFVRCIFESLAMKYKSVLEKIDSVTGNAIEQLHIVGGGSQNDMLNQLTSDACGIPVAAGPVEAAALGNIIVQAIADGTLKSVSDGREMVARSFPVKNYYPNLP